MKNILRKHIISLAVSIIIGATFLIMIVLFFLSMKTKTNSITSLKERIASYQKKDKTSVNEVAQLKVFENRVNSLESNVVNVETLPTLLSGLEILAQKNNIGFEITSVQTPIENDKPKLVIEFSSKGSYDQIQSFLNQLQHQGFQTQIAKLTLFSEEVEPLASDTAGTLSVNKIKTPIITKEKVWRCFASIEILSF